jgi:hypothetical protein
VLGVVRKGRSEIRELGTKRPLHTYSNAAKNVQKEIETTGFEPAIHKFTNRAGDILPGDLSLLTVTILPL